MDAEKQMTAEEFLAFAEQNPDKRFDFIDGEMVKIWPKPLNGRIQAILISVLSIYNQQNPIGVVYTETLHVLNGEKFIPDVCINVATDDDYLTAPRWLPSKFAPTPNPEPHSGAKPVITSGTAQKWSS